MNNVIGIVGGVGPYAGIDLATKIFDQTIAETDQEHLPVALLSFSGKIAERSSFVLGESDINPGYGISEVILELEKIGSSVVGIPCNTAHAPKIFNVILDELKRKNSKVQIVHMIDEVARFIHEEYPEINQVGVLSTLGTRESGIYDDCLAQNGLNIVPPDEMTLEKIHDAIYSIKAKSNPVDESTRQKLSESIDFLSAKGAEAVILGCTELPLAYDCTDKHLVIIDPAMVLARALIREFDPAKLKMLKVNQLITQ